jgi:hypothetical protein
LKYPATDIGYRLSQRDGRIMVFLVNIDTSYMLDEGGLTFKKPRVAELVMRLKYRCVADDIVNRLVTSSDISQDSAILSIKESVPLQLMYGR